MLTNNISLKQAIIRVIIFFDMFDFPLTAFEIWQYLGVECELAEVQNILNNNGVWNKFHRENGFYCLFGRGKIVETRMRRYNYADRKFKRALVLAKIFKIIPWIKLIAVGNMMGAGNAKDGSDIDLFIITERGRIWITRFFCAGIAKLLKLRPKVNNKKDKICLSFYVSEEGMDARRLMLKCDANMRMNANDTNREYANRGDIYFIYWLASLIPIYDAGGMYKRFTHKNNWLHFYLPNWRPVKMALRRKAGRGWGRMYRDVVDLFMGGLDSTVKKWQLKKMPVALKNLMNKNNQVVVNDKVLKLHANDRREEYRKRFRERINKVNQKFEVG